MAEAAIEALARRGRGRGVTPPACKRSACICVLLILATIFWGFAAFGGMWWDRRSAPWSRG